VTSSGAVAGTSSRATPPLPPLPPGSKVPKAKRPWQPKQAPMEANWDEVRHGRNERVSV
jgi:hypothetical protein